MKLHRSKGLICDGLKKWTIQVVLGLKTLQKRLLSKLKSLIDLSELGIFISRLLVGLN